MSTSEYPGYLPVPTDAYPYSCFLMDFSVRIFLECTHRSWFLGHMYMLLSSVTFLLRKAIPPYNPTGSTQGFLYLHMHSTCSLLQLSKSCQYLIDIMSYLNILICFFLITYKFEKLFICLLPLLVCVLFLHILHTFLFVFLLVQFIAVP